jgi:hypothetical protein
MIRIQFLTDSDRVHGNYLLATKSVVRRLRGQVFEVSEAGLKLLDDHHIPQSVRKASGRCLPPWHGHLARDTAPGHGLEARATTTGPTRCLPPWHGHLARDTAPGHGLEARATTTGLTGTDSFLPNALTRFFPFLSRPTPPNLGSSPSGRRPQPPHLSRRLAGMAGVEAGVSRRAPRRAPLAVQPGRATMPSCPLKV